MKTGIAHLIVLAAAAAMTLGATSTSAAEINQGSGYLRNVYTSQCLTDRGVENYPNAQECAFDGAGNVPPNQQWTRIPAAAGSTNWALLRSGLGNCLRHGTEAEHSPESSVCTNTDPCLGLNSDKCGSCSWTQGVKGQRSGTKLRPTSASSVSASTKTPRISS
ncbi:hypothetical protein [Nocardia altamirensis]|uniref:hypothetical protein n=1 Tax=Nocardia altamirensis TaxID=472158 RepID=UPI00114CB814|nr:hypothetical protein [Nocardia altamirensis]